MMHRSWAYDHSRRVLRPWPGSPSCVIRARFSNGARASLGETFIVSLFGFDLLFVFSPAAVRALYKLPEHDASFTEATRTLIGFKLPPELLSGDMSMFRHLFGRDKMTSYLDHIRDAVHEDITALGARGEIEIFGHMKRLVHRIGFRCWSGPEAASEPYLSELVELFERIDPEEAFVQPARTLITVLTRKLPERRALKRIEQILAEIWRARGGQREDDMLERLHELYADASEAERRRFVGRDVVLLHLASVANLYAALGWTLVNLLLRPELLDRAQRDPALLERCAHESIRMAQRSITLRKVVAPCRIDDGQTVYHLEPGVFLATMLSVNNCAFAGLSSFDPDHYDKHRVAADVDLPTPEVVSTYGHHAHACPGRRFATSAITIAVSELTSAFDWTPRFATAVPKPTQIGAVARAAEPCVARVRQKVDRSRSGRLKRVTSSACSKERRPSLPIVHVGAVNRPSARAAPSGWARRHRR